jgi:hypothetical protein
VKSDLGRPNFHASSSRASRCPPCWSGTSQGPRFSTGAQRALGPTNDLPGGINAGSNLRSSAGSSASHSPSNGCPTRRTVRCRRSSTCSNARGLNWRMTRDSPASCQLRVRPPVGRQPSASLSGTCAAPNPRTRTASWSSWWPARWTGADLGALSLRWNRALNGPVHLVVVDRAREGDVGGDGGLEHRPAGSRINAASAHVVNDSHVHPLQRSRRLMPSIRGHQVELRRPHIAKGRREHFERVPDPVVVRVGDLRGHVCVLVDTHIRRLSVNDRTVSPGGSRRSWGTPTSMTKHPPSSRCAATLPKQSTCSSCKVDQRNSVRVVCPTSIRWPSGSRM